MAQELINIGAVADDGTGDTIRRAGIKINSNFTELFARPSVASDINVVQNNISTTASDADLVIKPSGTGAVSFPGIDINDNTITASRSNDDLVFMPSGTGLVIMQGLSFGGTTINATDSSQVNINEAVIVDGTLTANGTHGTGGNVVINNTLDVTDLTTLHSLTVPGNTSLAGTTTVDNLTFSSNVIATSSNADLNFTPGGTGVVNFSNVTVDSSIKISESLTTDGTSTSDDSTQTVDQTGNFISTLRSNDDLLLNANGTGSVQISVLDLNEGTVDNTVIGATTPAAATFQTLTPGAELNIDGISITDNTITASSSNADLELTASGTGSVSINGVNFPNSGGTAGQVLQTDGNGQISFFTSPILFDSTLIDDGTVTLSGISGTQTIDSFSTSTYRSAKYNLQITDSTADRYTLIDVNVTHDGSSAYISSFGAASNGAGDGSTIYDSLDLSADISSGNVRLQGTVNNTNTQVIKFVRRIIRV
jgi:hypothetical protein